MKKCSNTNQKKYWKLLGQLEQKDRNNIQYVSPGNLANHFKSILTSNRSIKTPPNSTKIGKLDYPITSEELEKSKKSLKRGKASGLDNLCNEMILWFLELYPHIILTLFNTIMEKTLPLTIGQEVL